ncbi:hypothetical protein AAHE18_13G329100 [Arachis hypogaea]
MLTSKLLSKICSNYHITLLLFYCYQDNRIHCTIPKSVVRLFRPILSERQLYSISSFIVQKNNMWMKCSSLQYGITLLQRSMVVHKVVKLASLSKLLELT